jgi:parallel beta-helix repeat protein
MEAQSTFSFVSRCARHDKLRFMLLFKLLFKTRKITIHRPLALLFLMLSSCQLGWAATYYSDPAVLEGQGDGSAKAPWPKLEAMAKSGHLPQLQGGDTLLLRGGNHGEVRISGDNTATITIAAEAGQTPQLGRFEITQGSQWLIKGLTISPAFAATPYKSNIVTLAEGGPSSDIVLQDCFIYTALDSAAWSKDDWMNAYNGVMVGRNGTRMTLRNNYVLNTRFAVAMCAPQSLCEGNVIANFSGDGLRLLRDDITANYNVIKNGYLSVADGDENHDDLIQCFLFNKGTGTVNRLRVIGNILIGQEDPNQAFPNNPQGLGFFDGPLVDFDIEQNIVVSNTYHGISLYDAVNCKILDNFVKATSAQKITPWIMLNTKNKGGSSGNVVKNNMARAFMLEADPGVVAENNLPIDEAVFAQRMQQQAKIINDKFGEFHPVAKLPRLDLKQVLNKGLKQGEDKDKAPPA